MQPVVYTETEVEDLLKLPRGRIKSWRRYGFGPNWIQLGRDRRYTWKQVQDFLNDNGMTFNPVSAIPPWAQQDAKR